MTKDQIASLKSEYNSGIKPVDLMSKYNITKHALYHHVGGSKKASTPAAAPTPTIEFSDDDESVGQMIEQVQNPANIEVTDPLIDFDKIKTSSTRRNHDDFDDMLMRAIEEDDLFHPNSILKTEPKASAPSNISKSGLKSMFSGKKLKTEESKSPEEKQKELDQKRLKLVYQVRMYIYTFRDHDNLFCALNVENDNKKINKFIQDLYKRKIPELEKLLDFIKFHIRHNNNSVTGNLANSIFFTVLRVVELIVTKMGIDVTGLSDDLRNDPEMISNLKEIEIEMIASKYNLSPKADVLLKICTKGLTKYTENKLNNRMKDMKKDDSKIAVDLLSAKPINEELKNKYNDL
jgi:hypothetical protein